MKYLLYCALLLSVTGCDKKETVKPPITAPPSLVFNTSDGPVGPDQMVSAIQRMSHDIGQLQTKVDAQQTQLDLLWSRARANEPGWGADNVSVKFPVVTPLRTKQGTLYLKCERLDLLQQGVKLTLSIGNPLTVELSGIEFRCIHGISLPKNSGGIDSFLEASEKQNKSYQTNNFAPDVILKPASWTTFEVFFSPCKPEDLGFVSIDTFIARYVRFPNE